MAETAAGSQAADPGSRQAVSTAARSVSQIGFAAVGALGRAWWDHAARWVGRCDHVPVGSGPFDRAAFTKIKLASALALRIQSFAYSLTAAPDLVSGPHTAQGGAHATNRDRSLSP